MNKLHEALKNEELMLEVGRKATEEQKAMTQSTVEERFDNEFAKSGIVGDREFKEFLPNTYNSIIDFIKSELQLAEQKAREDERKRIASIIDWYFEGLIIIQEPKLTKQNLINTITKE